MKNKITVAGANITFFAFAVSFIVYQFVLVIPAMFYKDPNKFALDNFVWITLISEYIIILVPVFTYVLIKKMNIKEVFRLNNPGFLPCLVIILIAIPASYAAEAVNVIVLYLLDFLGTVPGTPIPAPKNISSLLVSLFVIAVTPALCEELLNRGIMMRAYEKRGTMKAVVISAVLFGIFHFSITNLLGPILLGLLIGYYVVKTNSIFAGMLAHFLNNAFSMISLYLSKERDLPSTITVSTEQLVSSVLLGVIALIIVFFLLKFFNMTTKNRGTMQPSISNARGDVISIISHWPMIVVMSLFVFINLLTLFTIVFKLN